jgi:hypothetical protein
MPPVGYCLLTFRVLPARIHCHLRVKLPERRLTQVFRPAAFVVPGYQQPCWNQSPLDVTSCSSLADFLSVTHTGVPNPTCRDAGAEVQARGNAEVLGDLLRTGKGLWNRLSHGVGHDPWISGRMSRPGRRRVRPSISRKLRLKAVSIGILKVTSHLGKRRSFASASEHGPCHACSPRA